MLTYVVVAGAFGAYASVLCHWNVQGVENRGVLPGEMVQRADIIAAASNGPRPRRDGERGNLLPPPSLRFFKLRVV